MNINHNTPMIKVCRPIACRFFAIMFALCVAMTGCNETDSPVSQDSTVEKLPKLYLHCPDDFGVSVKRLRTLYDQLSSDAPLPDPKIIKVLEIIHGEGAGAHSHYHLAGQPHEEDHHEEEMVEREKTHDVEIDPFTEFRDIAWVLPNVAAQGDMQETEWVSVKKNAHEIVEIFDDLVGGKETDDQKRETFVNDNEKIGQLLKQLESVATTTLENSTTNKE